MTYKSRPFEEQKICPFLGPVAAISCNSLEIMEITFHNSSLVVDNSWRYYDKMAQDVPLYAKMTHLPAWKAAQLVKISHAYP